MKKVKFCILALMLAMALPSWAQNSLADYEFTTGVDATMWRARSGEHMPRWGSPVSWPRPCSRGAVVSYNRLVD